ncbi:MAG: penicillin acylase family protein [Deltaproteobacteria bacterium]
MKRRYYALGAGVIVLAVGVAAWWSLPRLNDYQRQGNLNLPGLIQPVSVQRDGKGMAYIRARNLDDAIMAQGFVTAQDRLFQMQLTRLLAQGRIAELAGDRARSLDIMMRTIGIHRNAKKHAAILDEKTRHFFQQYVDGVNAFVTTRTGSHPLEFKLAGIKAEPWSISDALSVAYYMGWITSANAGTEVITQMLVDKVGPVKAREIFPLNINPDEPTGADRVARIIDNGSEPLHLTTDRSILTFCRFPVDGSGSNNWAVAPKLSPSGKPIVANDPHLDARILPGVWYPCGIITPELRAVGVMIPGIPGMVIGRTDRVAMGVTNAYGDCQDLFVESLDPSDSGRYLEGDTSVPFTVIKETMKIRDKNAPGGLRAEEVEIKLTRRGPVVSGVLPGLNTSKVISLRWAASETMAPSMGLQELLTARSAEEVREAIKQISFVVLNCVFADVDGNIGWHVSGKLPIRSQRDSTVPYVVKDGKDNWTGWIPFAEMPHSMNSGKGWVGTCNHKTVGKDYPYYYSSYFAPSYRYRRLKQILERPGVRTVDEHWQLQRDTKNLMAEQMAPVFAQALLAHEDTKEMGQILSAWDHRDDTDQAGATVFQGVYRNLAYLVFRDELGAEIMDTMLGTGYFWQERFQKMVMDGASPWFDNVLTPNKKETLDDLLHVAASQAAKTFEGSLGKDPAQWQWGKVHQIEFVNPLRRSGIGKSLVGGAVYPMGGSRETLYCGWYDFRKPFDVILSASLRMVADLGDEEKVMAGSNIQPAHQRSD